MAPPRDRTVPPRRPAPGSRTRHECGGGAPEALVEPGGDHRAVRSPAELVQHRQVTSVVEWEAASEVVIAMIVGTPLGIALGRLAWNFFASHYSVVAVVVVPWWQGAVIVASSLVVVTAIALLAASYLRHAPDRRSTSSVSGQPETEHRCRTPCLPGRASYSIRLGVRARSRFWPYRVTLGGLVIERSVRGGCYKSWLLTQTNSETYYTQYVL